MLLWHSPSTLLPPEHFPPFSQPFSMREFLSLSLEPKIQFLFGTVPVVYMYIHICMCVEMQNRVYPLELLMGFLYFI